MASTSALHLFEAWRCKVCVQTRVCVCVEVAGQRVSLTQGAFVQCGLVGGVVRVVVTHG